MDQAAEHRQRLEAFIRKDFQYPDARFRGRGIVICAGGTRYFTNAWVCLNMLRFQGCQLPVQFWHLGTAEMSDEMRDLVKPLGASCVDAHEVRRKFPVRTLNGWELKAFALLHSPFQQVLLLDADNVATRNPEYLFDTPEFADLGAIFWPDYGRLAPSRTIWKILGVDYRDEPEVESGQMLIDKSRTWKSLNLAMFFNEWSDYYYRYIHGDKETFHLAWRKLNQSYAMPQKAIHSLDGCVMVQHDLDSETVFQHRNMRKWRLDGANLPVNGFLFEKECLTFLEELRHQWSDAPGLRLNSCEMNLAAQIIAQKSYLYVRVGFDSRILEFKEDWEIGAGAASMEKNWDVRLQAETNQVLLRIRSENNITCALTLHADGIFQGQWSNFEKMPIRLIPIRM